MTSLNQQYPIVVDQDQTDPDEWKSSFVIVIHDDRAGREASRFEEVLGEAMTGQDMCVEFRDPAPTRRRSITNSHLLSQGDFLAPAST